METSYRDRGTRDREGLETFLVEWKLLSLSGRLLLSPYLETFLVEWKLARIARRERTFLTLETFLVEWKQSPAHAWLNWAKTLKPS